MTNLLSFLQATGMTKRELAEKAGVSVSFVSDLTHGKANPSLRVMEAIAKAMDTSLPWLLEATEVLAEGTFSQRLPGGYERITVILPEHQAFIVKQWAKAANGRRTDLEAERQAAIRMNQRDAGHLPDE